MPTNNYSNSPLISRGGTTSSFTADQRSQLVNLGAQITPTIQRLYSIFLWNLDTSDILEVSKSLDPAGRTNKAEYFFETPPKVNDMTEPFATRIIATQNGGKYIESHGSIFKDIRVSGTTGLRPRKKVPSEIPLLPTDSFLGVAEAFTSTGFGNQIRKIPSDEKTGFDDIHFLRNIFRRYSDSKGSNEHLIMVWRNVKDDDYWVVEPRSFKLVQNSQSPLTYTYQLDLQGLSRFDAGLPAPVDDPLAALRSAGRFFSRIQEFKQNLLGSFLVISTQIKRIQGAGHFLINNSLGTLTAVIKGLTAVFSATSDVRHGLVRSIKEAKEDWTNALADLTKSLNTAQGVALSADQIKTYDNFAVIINTARKVLRTLDKLLVEPTFQDNISTAEREVRERIKSSYRTPGAGTGAPSSPRSAGDPTYIGNSSSPGAISESRVQVGETIRDASMRLLGDFRRWHELVLLNDLRAPYIASSEAPGVLVPGDSILYPSTSGSVPSDIRVNSANLSNAETEEQDENVSGVLSQSYGRDLRLRSVVSGNIGNLTDVAINQRGDLATIVGIPNVKQAILIKFSTERGTLAAHPNFGARFPIGSKADVVSFNEFRINTLATLRSDTRVKEIPKLEFRTVKDVLYVSASLVLQDGSEFLNTDFALRRF